MWFVIKNKDGKYYELTMGWFIDDIRGACTFESVYEASEIACELEDKLYEEVEVVRVFYNEEVVRREEWE